MPHLSKQESNIDEKLEQVIRSIQQEIDVDEIFGSGQAIGRYSILGFKGTGGQAYVFRAFDENLRRKVIIKLYKKNLSEQEKRRIVNEGRALANIDSPHVAKCYGVELSGENPYLVLEDVDGTALDQYVVGREVSPREALSICMAIARGIQSVHESGFLHLDLKPANVIVTDSGKVKLIDFGLAQAIDSEIETEISGSPAYIPPECANQRWDLIGTGTDVFGIGAIYYFLLTGTPPHSGDSRTETLERARTKAIVPPIEKVDISKRANDLCMSCVESDVSKRVSSAAAFLQLGRRLQKTRRLLVRLAVAAFLTGAIALASVFSFGNWFASTTESERINPSQLPQAQVAVDRIADLLRKELPVKLDEIKSELVITYDVSTGNDLQTQQPIRSGKDGEFEFKDGVQINLNVKSRANCFVAVYAINDDLNKNYLLEAIYPNETNPVTFLPADQSRSYPIEIFHTTDRPEYFLVVASNVPWLPGDLSESVKLRSESINQDILEIRGGRAAKVQEQIGLQLIKYRVSGVDDQDADPGFDDLMKESNKAAREDGNPELAIRLCEQAIAICGSDDPSYAKAKLWLAEIRYNTGDFLGCRDALRDAVNFAERSGSYVSPNNASVLFRLSFIANGMGDLKLARSRSEQAVNVIRKLGVKGGPASGRMAEIFTFHAQNLLRQSQRIEDQKSKQLLLEKATTILDEAESRIDSESPGYALALVDSTRGMLHQEKEEFEKAIELISKANKQLDLAIKANDEVRRNSKYMLENQLLLARFNYRREKFDEARKYWNLALNSKLGIGKLQTISTYQRLGAASVNLEDFVAGRHYFDEAIKRTEELVLGKLRSVGEFDGVGATRDVRINLTGILRTTDLSDPGNAIDAYRHVFNTKGIVSRMLKQRMALLRAGGSPIFEGYMLTSNKLNQQIISAVYSGVENSDAIANLRKEKNRLAAKLIKSTAGNAAPNLRRSLDELNARIPDDVAIVDIVKIDALDDFDPNLDPEYHAFVVTKNEDHELQVVHIKLGLVADIDHALMSWIESVRFVETQLTQKGGRAAKNPKPGKAQFTKLSELWQSIQTQLGTKKKILISPDGRLAMMPWPALYGSDGNRNIENYEISTIPDAQFYVDAPESKDKSVSLLALAGADFGEIRDREGNRWTNLETTVTEAEQIVAIAEKTKGKTRLLVGKDATKENFKSTCKDQRFILLSTHGISLTVPDHLVDSVSRNPLSMTGLVFDGANLIEYPIPADSKEDLPIFTGEDALHLDLSGTELVVLSACDSGSGMDFQSEGIFGIQRAMLWSGAGSCLASRWQLEGNAATKFTTAFFEKVLIEGKSKPQALREVQLEMHKHGIEPRFWASWDLLGI